MDTIPGIIFRKSTIKYVSFIVVDLICLIISSAVAATFYHSVSTAGYKYQSYWPPVIAMCLIDVAITVIFKTLDGVLCRRKRLEVLEALKHVAICFVLLALLLFSAKQGSSYSRVSIYLTYIIDYVLIVVLRMAWKWLLLLHQKHKKKRSVLLITTSGYEDQGLETLTNADVKGIFITDKSNEGAVSGIPVLVDRNNAITMLCWEPIDEVYVCGSDSLDVPQILVQNCKKLGIPVRYTQARKSFDYEVIRIRTVYQNNNRDCGLSFLESERDIPFRINRIYAIYEGEKDKQKGFHAHKQSWHLLFCPYGAIEVYIDTGKEKKRIMLDSPSTGLILHPGIWRDMEWKQSDSVLCVAASGHYDSDRLRDNYDDYLTFLKKKEWAEFNESIEIFGESVI